MITLSKHEHRLMLTFLYKYFRTIKTYSDGKYQSANITWRNVLKNFIHGNINTHANGQSNHSCHLYFYSHRSSANTQEITCPRCIERLGL